MKYIVASILILLSVGSRAQTSLDLSGYSKKGEAKISLKENLLTATWPTGHNESGKLVLDLSKDKPLFKSIQMHDKEIASGLDPAFILTIGKRDLISQNGWNIFFDKVPLKPHESYTVNFEKDSASVRSEG
ncbi:MAG: hypothetical protein ABI184_09295, partial [Ginsengibacter sp.]